ncbi:MAG: MBL fold metallo-hydrolase [Chloroflexota bacterium]|nr:MBL fold metallo-hydrolase [Chloroflexota bacterium]
MAEFRWFGHNCFRIRAKEAIVMTDPVGRVTGYSLPKQTVDLVTLSHDHPGHANLDAIRPEFSLLRGPGEYEVHDVFVTGIRTYHDAQQGAERGYNTVYLIELEGIVICHLGDIGHALTEEQAESMSNVDVLLVPVGTPVLDPSVAAEIVTQLAPKVVIPMQYATERGDRKLGGLEPFCKELGIEPPVAEEKLTLRQSDLGETLRLVALRPE